MTAYYLVASILFCLILATGFRLRNTVLAGSRFRIWHDGVERSPNFYAPMDRLLSENDFRYLKTRPEIPQSSIDRIRRDRRRIFRKYLGFMAADFAIISTEIRTVTIQSHQSRPDLVKSLAQARLLFSFAMLAIEFRLLLHSCGIRGLNISPGHLTASLNQIRNQLRLLSPAPVISIQTVSNSAF